MFVDHGPRFNEKGRRLAMVWTKPLLSAAVFHNHKRFSYGC